MITCPYCGVQYPYGVAHYCSTYQYYPPTVQVNQVNPYDWHLQRIATALEGLLGALTDFQIGQSLTGNTDDAKVCRHCQEGCEDPGVDTRGAEAFAGHTDASEDDDEAIGFTD